MRQQIRVRVRRPAAHAEHTPRLATMRARRVPSLLRKPVIRVMLAVGVVVVIAGLALFQPWQLWVDKTVNEALPRGGPGVLIAQGTLVGHQHATSGTVRILRLADGSRLLRLENLDTTNGPDLKVWLTDAPFGPATRAGGSSMTTVTSAWASSRATRAARTIWSPRTPTSGSTAA
jgi:hypothetical protein